MPCRVVSLWPAHDGDARLVAHVAHPAPVVGPAAGLLEPADVEVRDAPAEVDRLRPARSPGWRRPSARSRGRPPRGPPGRARRPRPGVRPPTLNLTPQKPCVDVAPHGSARSSPVEVVVATDDADRHAVGRRSPRAGGAAGRRPGRRASQIAVSRQAMAWSARPRSRRMLLVEGSMASQAPSGSVALRPMTARRQLVVDDPDDAAPARRRCRRCRPPTTRPSRGGQPGHDRAPVVHAVGAAREAPGQRRPQRDGLDPLDDERARSETARGARRLRTLGRASVIDRPRPGPPPRSRRPTGR